MLRTFRHTIDSLSQHTILADVAFTQAWVRQAPTETSPVDISVWGIGPDGSADSNPATLYAGESLPLRPQAPLTVFPVNAPMLQMQPASGTVTLEITYDEFATL
jgi:hypothetical protein